MIDTAATRQGQRQHRVVGRVAGEGIVRKSQHPASSRGHPYRSLDPGVSGNRC